MTLVRMQNTHGLKISDEERRALVKRLADKQGLAPSETAPVRYALERRLNTVEQFESEALTQMCARCHSGARVALQRRSEKEWAHLVHFHLGQLPSLEFQSLGRDRDWFGVALKEVVPDLAKQFSVDDPAWKDWQAQTPQPVTGTWSVSGHLPGKGGFIAEMSVKSQPDKKDHYVVSWQGKYDDGSVLNGQGSAVLYTGYEWRAHVDVDGVAWRQVFALDHDALKGRMFQREHDEIGADIVAVRHESGNSRVLAVHPAYLKTGQTGTLTVVGNALSGKLALPAGVRLLKIIEQSPQRIVAQVVADRRALGVHTLSVGKTKGGTLAVFERIERIRVLPEFAVARVGGNGGSEARVDARFEAEAWARSASGEYRIGLVPAKWSVAPFNADAERDRDVEFAGAMNAVTGIFTPAPAGPNPARHLMTNNAGNLAVTAEVTDGKTALQGTGQLIVTVQRWNNPPIP
ncbi:hypothetical protein FACS1894185_1200 [Betaproteobacteria bacterium]|nr:hypothetical protein FACS1894185_1200 [Betaproteobacteria bacterium]